jgi:hypothetical protein
MSKHIQLSITDPCHENWDNMTQAEQGRFCGSCQKQVVDFTNMSDSQLAAFFKKPSTGSVCGRFFQDQLERDVEIPKKRIPWVKYFFQIALPAFLMSAKASAQGEVRVKKADITVAPSAPVMQGMVSLPPRKKIEVFQTITIKGKITDENNNPVPFASVMIKGTNVGTPADSNGIFRLNNPSLQRGVLLEVSSVGYETKEITISKEADLEQDMVIRLTRAFLDEVIVNAGVTVKGSTRVMMGGISVGRCEKKTDIIPVVKSPEETQPMIKVYPNPVLSGSTINIGCEKLEEGYYTFQLFNQSGQQIQSKQIWIDAEARLMNMELPVVVAGNYILVLTNKESGKKFTEKIIIE